MKIGHPPLESLQLENDASHSWASLGYFAVNLSGGQPKMY